MHNVWTLIRREYLERVRTRSFVIFTLLMPAAMAGMSPFSGVGFSLCEDAPRALGILPVQSALKTARNWVGISCSVLGQFTAL